MALLLDNSSKRVGAFILTRTLLEAGLADLNDDFIGMRCYEEESISFRTKGALSFLSNCWSDWHLDAFRYWFQYDSESVIRVCEMLCEFGLELSSPLSTHKRHYWSEFHRRPHARSTHRFYVETLILTISHALIRLLTLSYRRSPKLFPESEYGIDQLLRLNLIFPEPGEDDMLFSELRFNIHYGETSRGVRICRQLFALGLYRQPDNKLLGPENLWPMRCIYGSFEHCFACCLTHFWEDKNLLKVKDACPKLACLVREFLSGPLTLQQLSRIEIRRRIGLHQFERRINTLPLPPSLLKYVARANELLEDTLLS